MKKIITLAVSAALLLSVGCSLQQKSATDEVKAYTKFVPEREDDFAWENDLVAFRMYGPASKSTGTVSGVDCWLKRVDYSILDKWYADHQKGISYHVDHGEGHDPYHVGTSRGCGGTAVWLNGKPYPAGAYKAWRVIDNSQEKVTFELDYAWQIDLGDVKETKRITLVLGSQLYKVESTFLLNNKPAKNLAVAVGLSTHNSAASTSADKASGWIATWENLKGYSLGTGAKISADLVDDIIHIPSENKDESHIWLISHTDEQGKFRYSAGYAWQRAQHIQTMAAWQKYLKNSPL